MVLRNSPATDFPLGLAIVEVDNVWTRAKEAARSDADPAEWDDFVRASERRLGPIAASLESTTMRGPGIWGWLMPTDESADRTRHDLIQLIRNEIPAALAAQPRASAVQDRGLQPWLDRVQTYLMGARDG